MKILTLTVDQSRELDRRTTAEFGIPSYLLMENAGRNLAGHIEKILTHFPRTTILIFLCGGGNNGGDGFVAARHIYLKHPQVKIYLMKTPPEYKGDALLNYKILAKLGIPFKPFSEFTKDRRSQFQNTPLVIVDALLGTGLKGTPENDYREAIFQTNDLKKYHNAKVTIISADIPSGLDGDDGPQGSEAVLADLTVTFGAIKKGLVKLESKPYVGRLEVVDIGIPEPLMRTYCIPGPHSPQN